MPLSLQHLLDASFVDLYKHATLKTLLFHNQHHAPVARHLGHLIFQPTQTYELILIQSYLGYNVPPKTYCLWGFAHRLQMNGVTSLVTVCAKIPGPKYTHVVYSGSRHTRGVAFTRFNIHLVTRL